MFFIAFALLSEETDRLTFEKLYQKFHEDIYRRIYYILQSHEESEDAMQETWISVVKNIHKFYDKEDYLIRAYIMKIARNQAISILRKKRKEEAIMCEMDLEELSDNKELFRACDDCGVELVLKCVNRLDLIYREVLNLYYFHEHSLKEIATLLNLKENTVWSRLRRGRLQLIELLKKEGYHD